MAGGNTVSLSRGGLFPVLLSTGPYVLFRSRRRSREHAYQPPPTAAIEKMKTTRLKEQKAFALIREILGGQLPAPGVPDRHILECTLECPPMSPLLPLGLSFCGWLLVLTFLPEVF